MLINSCWTKRPHTHTHARTHSDNGEQLRMYSVTGVCNEGEMSPGGKEMVTSGGER